MWLEIDLYASIEKSKQTEKKEKKEDTWQKKERLVIFEIKRKISPSIVKNKLKEVEQLRQDLKEMKKLWIEDDFLDKIKRIKEIENWIKENVIVHYVEKWDTLWGLCKEYYENPTYSSILTNKLWYEERIIAGKYLYLPSRKDMVRLVRVIKQNKTNNNFDVDISGFENKEPNNLKESNRYNNSKNKETKNKVDSLEEKKLALVKQAVVDYGEYLSTYADNLGFVSMWRRSWYNQLKSFSREIIRVSKTTNSIKEIYEGLVKFKNKFRDEKFNENFDKLLEILKQLVEGKISLEESRVLLIQTLREIDKNDDGILWNNALVNWNYEMEIDNLMLPHIEKLDILSNKLKEVLEKLNKLKHSQIVDLLLYYISPGKKEIKYGHNYNKIKKDYSLFYEELKKVVWEYEITRRIRYREYKEDLVKTYAKEILQQLLPNNWENKLKEFAEERYEKYEKEFDKGLKEIELSFKKELAEKYGYEFIEKRYTHHWIRKVKYEFKH